MPELPEVETIARSLAPELIGRQILSARLLWNRTLETPAPEVFIQQIVGQTVEAVGRRAKYLYFQLSGLSLFIHLRMTGDLRFQEASYQSEKHDRLLLELSSGRLLVFSDPRKFGRIWLTAHPEDVIGKLGPEPFHPAFTAQVLHARLLERRRLLKPLLLDQSFLSGLGNIYTDEALHLSGLHPLRLSDTITFDEAQKLYHAIQTVLLAGIEHNGASIDWAYRGGNFQNYFRVYDRAGEPCLVCGTPVERIVVGQRGTHFCPKCQVRL